MGKYIFGLLAIAIIAVVCLYTFDPSYRAERAAAAWEAEQRARITIEQERAFAPVWTAFKVAAVALAGLGAFLALAFATAFGMRQLLLVQPDERALLPMPLVGFERLADTSRLLLEAQHDTERAQITTTIDVQGRLLERLLAAEPARAVAMLED